VAKALAGKNGNWLLAGMLAAALVWAYWAAHPAKTSPTGADQPFPLWEVAPKDVTRITIHSAKRSLILEPESGGEGANPYIWIRSEVNPPAALAKTEETAENTEPPDEEKELGPQFKGNRSAEQSLSALATLLVQRRIGKLEELSNPLQYGLPTDLEYVELARKGGAPLRLNLGGSTFGDSYRYVQFAQDGAVYLLKQATVQGLTRSPIRLMDRDLFPFPTASATRLDLRMGPGAVSFFRLTSAAADSPEWGASPEAEAGEPGVQVWMTDLAKLKALNYAGRDDPAAGNAALEATLTAEGHAPVTFKLLEQQDNNWIAVSTHTRHPVRLNGKLAEALLESARPLLEGK
jgi:hypothetical protein